ncbi:type II secretion system secretin GspD [Jannaschia seohaensis]|uniref:General secretion pathway protein D n=1 Tax=Jannaschia seohaensis TaxID=475081 RepID=A0A2Y9B590_9RHOB|nr:type II secretion system secretin GspD [Jannaschia seohaensis]PWJ15800.1 general secretion pathway protein D [Jannaschia seohaensis]SSA49489.1 general secretion pathway protein D [Jannaschia seohaensis]
MESCAVSTRLAATGPINDGGTAAPGHEAGQDMKTSGILRAAWIAAVLAVAQLPAPQAAAQVQLDLRDADLRSFVEIVSEATGRNFLIDPGVRGTVTVLAPQELSAADLYDVFLNVLELNRLTLITGNGADRIVPMNVARELSSGAPQGGIGDFQTRVIEVRNVPLSEIIEVVRPLLPAEAVITPVPRSNLLILSDRGRNFGRIADLIERLDRPSDRPIEMIRLRNADARDVLDVIQSMDIVPPGAAVSVDRRSNALVVTGPEDLRQQLRRLAARLDTQQSNVVSTAIELSYADAAALADVVLRAISNQTADSASPQGEIRIVPEPQTNALLITAPQDRIDDIAEMVQFLDRRPSQVLVEAVIFEMSVEGFSDLSVQFAGLLDDAIVGGVEFALTGRPSLTNLVAAVANDAPISPGSGGTFGVGRRTGGDGIVGLISAIATSNSTRLLSTPSIMTLNNEEAEIVVAQNVPFLTGSFATVGEDAVPENPFQTIERQDVGLTLRVTPQINVDRTVKMAIEQEVSSLTNSNASTGGEITARRALTTNVLVRDGNVILLGGLLENGSGAVTQRVPGLSRLPLVGGLFRGKNASQSQSVLLILLRPRVVESESEGTRLTREIAREAKAASLAIAAESDDIPPRTRQVVLPFDGADLNQPFDAGFVDDAAQIRDYPPLPSRLRFDQKN